MLSSSLIYFHLWLNGVAEIFSRQFLPLQHQRRGDLYQLVDVQRLGSQQRAWMRLCARSAGLLVLLRLCRLARTTSFMRCMPMPIERSINLMCEGGEDGIKRLQFVPSALVWQLYFTRDSYFSKEILINFSQENGNHLGKYDCQTSPQCKCLQLSNKLITLTYEENLSP